MSFPCFLFIQNPCNDSIYGDYPGKLTVFPLATPLQLHKQRPVKIYKLILWNINNSSPQETIIHDNYPVLQDL